MKPRVCLGTRGKREGGGAEVGGRGGGRRKEFGEGWGAWRREVGSGSLGRRGYREEGSVWGVKGDELRKGRGG